MPPKACTKGIASCTSGAGGLRGFWLWASYTSHALFDIIAVRLLFKGHDKHIEQPASTVSSSNSLRLQSQVDMDCGDGRYDRFTT